MKVLDADGKVVETAFVTMCEKPDGAGAKGLGFLNTVELKDGTRITSIAHFWSRDEVERFVSLLLIDCEKVFPKFNKL